MEAPEKIWMNDEWVWQFDDKDFMGEDSIEYVRKDAFVERACEFLKSYRQDTIDGTGYIAGIVNDKTIEEFKKAMEI